MRDDGPKETLEGSEDRVTFLLLLDFDRYRQMLDDLLHLAMVSSAEAPLDLPPTLRDLRLGQGIRVRPQLDRMTRGDVRRHARGRGIQDGGRDLYLVRAQHICRIQFGDRRGFSERTPMTSRQPSRAIDEVRLRNREPTS